MTIYHIGLSLTFFTLYHKTVSYIYLHNVQDTSKLHFQDAIHNRSYKNDLQDDVDSLGI